MANTTDNFKINVEEELEILYSIFTSTIIDCDYIDSVSDEIYAYFNKYNFLSHAEKQCVLSEIRNKFSRKERTMKRKAKANNIALRSAFDTYKSQINQPNKGLGFDIITNNVVDAAAYVAMGSLSEAKQNMAKTISANKNLTKALQKINSNDETSICNFEDFTDDFRKALENVKTFYNRKQFFNIHNDFYVNKSRYDNGSKIDGKNVYDIMAMICDGKTIATYYERLKTSYGNNMSLSLLDKFIAQGYIERYAVRIPERVVYFVTTLKYENEVLDEIINRELSKEERIKIEKEKETIYNKCIELKNGGKYYEAATGLASISEFNDALQKSLEIWHEKLLPKTSLIAIEFWSRMAFGLKDDGTVLWYNKDKNEGKDISQWKDVTKILNPNPKKLTVSTFDGRVLSINPYSDGDYKSSNLNIENSEKREKIFKRKDMTIIITKNGGMLCNKKDFFTTYKEWSKVEDIVFLKDKMCVLEKGGTVIEAKVLEKGQTVNIQKECYGTPLEKWKNIIRICEDWSGVIGLSTDGKLFYWGENCELAAWISNCKNIVRLCGDYTDFSNKITIINADGTVSAYNCKVDLSKWKDIIEVHRKYDRIIGVKTDGTLVVGGFNGDAPATVEFIKELAKWKLFDNINTRKNTKEYLIQNAEKNTTEKISSLKKEMEIHKTTAANLTGIFSFFKRKKIERKISSIEGQISRSQKYLKMLDTLKYS